MASRDLHNNINVVSALNITAVSGNGASVGPIIDTAGYKGIDIVLRSGTLTDGTYTPSIEGGNAANLSDTVALTNSDLHGTLAGATFAATDDNAIKRVGVKASYRYYRLTVTAAGVTTGGTISALAVLGTPELAPTT